MSTPINTEKAMERLRSLPTPPQLSTAAVARVEAALSRRTSKVGLLARLPRWPLVVGPLILGPLAMASLASTGVLGEGGARMVKKLWRAAVHHDLQVASVPVPAAPAPVPQQEEAFQPLDVSMPATGGVASKAVHAAAPVDPLLAESRLLGRALKALRQEENPAKALRLLQSYRREFPAGQLRTEASMARIEAAMAADRHGEALEELDGFDRTGFASVPRRTELMVLRGELLVEASRAGQAITTLESALSANPTPAQRQRALLALTRAHLATGDHAAAKNDADRLQLMAPGSSAAVTAHNLVNR